MWWMLVGAKYVGGYKAFRLDKDASTATKFALKYKRDLHLYVKSLVEENVEVEERLEGEEHVEVEEGDTLVSYDSKMMPKGYTLMIMRRRGRIGPRLWIC